MRHATATLREGKLHAIRYMNINGVFCLFEYLRKLKMEFKNVLLGVVLFTGLLFKAGRNSVIDVQMHQ